MLENARRFRMDIDVARVLGLVTRSVRNFEKEGKPASAVTLAGGGLARLLRYTRTISRTSAQERTVIFKVNTMFVLMPLSVNTHS